MWMAISVLFGPGMRFVAPTRSRKCWWSIQPRLSTTSFCIMAICAAGPPKAVKPSFVKSCASSRREVPPEEVLPEEVSGREAPPGEVSPEEVPFVGVAGGGVLFFTWLCEYLVGEWRGVRYFYDVEFVFCHLMAVVAGGGKELEGAGEAGRAGVLYCRVEAVEGGGDHGEGGYFRARGAKLADVVDSFLY